MQIFFSFLVSVYKALCVGQTVVKESLAESEPPVCSEAVLLRREGGWGFLSGLSNVSLRPS